MIKARELKNTLFLMGIMYIGARYIIWVSENVTAAIGYVCYIMFLWFHYLYAIVQVHKKKEYDDLLKLVELPKGRHELGGQYLNMKRD